MHILMSLSITSMYLALGKLLKYFPLEFQVEAAFKKFDQTGNAKLNFREFREMMTKKAETKESKVKEKEPENVPDQEH